MTGTLNFATVLQALDLSAGPDTAAQWQEFADSQEILLPGEFLRALSLGAESLLTRFSNEETLEIPGGLYRWTGIQVLPLLRENQGNFVFGLALNAHQPAPVLIAHEFEVHRPSQPVNWQVYTSDFSTFAFARLLDFQYLCSDFAGDEGWFVEGPALTPQTEQGLALAFRRGPTTLDAYSDQDTRHRFYRTGQRVAVSVRDAGTLWEFGAATRELHVALQQEIHHLIHAAEQSA